MSGSSPASSAASAASESAQALATLDALWPQLLEVKRPPLGVMQREELPLDDPWDPGVSELNLLARPFMERCGLDDLDVFVELWDGDEKLRGLPDAHNTRPEHAPCLWLDSIVEGLCIFAGEAAGVMEVQPCVSATAAAVAEAFLRQSKITAANLGPQEVVLDVAAAALGFFAAQLPAPTTLAPTSLLAVVASLCHRTDLDPAAVELAIAPRWHPTFSSILTDA